jgi:hypothetical protein
VLKRCLFIVNITASAIVPLVLLVLRLQAARPREGQGQHTILNQNVEALLDEKVVIEHDETEGEREHIIAGPDLEELANPPLCCLIDGLAGTALQGRPAEPRIAALAVCWMGKPNSLSQDAAGDHDGRLSRDGHAHQTLHLLFV